MIQECLFQRYTFMFVFQFFLGFFIEEMCNSATVSYSLNIVENSCSAFDLIFSIIPLRLFTMFMTSKRSISSCCKDQAWCKLKENTLPITCKLIKKDNLWSAHKSCDAMEADSRSSHWETRASCTAGTWLEVLLWNHDAQPT